MADSPNYYYFPVIIDGEVAMCLGFPSNHPNSEKLVAIWSSNPTVMPWHEHVAEGSIWDGTKFTEPS